MAQLNQEFLLSFTIMTAALFMTIRLVYLRTHRETYIKKKKYRPGSIEYKNIQKFTSTPVIAILTTASLLFSVLTISSMLTLLESNDPDARFVLVVVPLATIVMYAFAFVVGRQIFKE
jgi:hypothetical protein